MNSIIIIEDDIQLRNNLKTVLTKHGYNVTAIGSAEEFYRIISQANFIVAIVDIGLPDNDDFEIVAFLSKHTKSKIIIMSAKELVEDRVSGYSSGADIYFVKPVESIELLAAIESQVKKYKLERVENSEENSGKWVIEQNDRSLISPNKNKMFLTSLEWEFINILISNTSKTVSREQLMNDLGYGNTSPENNNSLDAIVTRVRRKSKLKCGTELPVKTLRNYGYQFEDSVEINFKET